jgi:ABC-type nitrate/sulfonate/bicarbonate transport system ATPase subunit
MIDLNNMTFSYRSGAAIFERFTWSVAAGESWAVIGPSGCGKTTLLYLISGLYSPSSGSITVAGESVPRKDRGRTGLILQDYGLLPWATVQGNVELGLRIRQFYGLGELDQETRERIAFWLQRLGIDGLRDKYPSHISGGQRQRAAIARTLALQPDVLLMDEPFSSLDALSREDLQNVVLGLQEEMGITTVVVTHNIEEAVLLGRQILVLGQPPISALRVVDNPCEDLSIFRQEADFHAQCSELRNRLAQ